jgi:hypothetical protein
MFVSRVVASCVTASISDYFLVDMESGILILGKKFGIDLSHFFLLFNWVKEYWLNYDLKC